MPCPSTKASLLNESVIREMTRLCTDHSALNLAQGFPDVDPDPYITEALVNAVRSGFNQYSYTWGDSELRKSLGEVFRRDKNLEYDPDEEILITCGNSEALTASILTVADKGDKIIVFEPFYENYLPGLVLAGAEPVFVKLHDNSIDIPELEKAFASNPCAIIINTPHNPTGKVLTEWELKEISRLCNIYDVIAITDETYEYITYDDNIHISPASIEGMKSRTITTGSFSKTFGVTGWRVGYAAAGVSIMKGIRKFHDYLTICAPTPMQRALIEILKLPHTYYEDLRRSYKNKRDYICSALTDLGFRLFVPQGAYYLMADFSSISSESDTDFASILIREAGVGSVPGSSFYRNNLKECREIRFAFPRRIETLEKAVDQLRNFLEK